MGAAAASSRAPSGRRSPGCEVRLADDGEVLCRGGNVFARLPRRSRAHGRGARRGRMAAQRRHRQRRRGRLLPHRRSQEGADHHGRRQEREPREPRGEAQARAARRPGHARSATTGPSSARCWCSTPRRRTAFAQAEGIDATRPRRARAPSPGARGGPAGVERGDGGLQPRRAGQTVRDPGRRVAPGLRRAHADVQAQAPEHRREVRRRDRLCTPASPSSPRRGLAQKVDRQ